MVTKTKAEDVVQNEPTYAITIDDRNLYQRLLAAKQNFGTIVKNKVNPRFKSKYTDLDTIIAAIEPALNAEGLLLVGICQPMSNDAWVIGYRLVNKDNPDDKTEQTIPTKDFDPQKQGGAITYLRRYVLGLMFNLTTEEDDEGNSVSEQLKASDTQTTQKRGGAGAGQAFLPGQEDDW